MHKASDCLKLETICIYKVCTETLLFFLVCNSHFAFQLRPAADLIKTCLLACLAKENNLPAVAAQARKSANSWLQSLLGRNHSGLSVAWNTVTSQELRWK